MKILRRINETILFHKVKTLDSKYFATLCDNWEEKHNLDTAYCFPYNMENPNFGHTSSEVPISIGIKAMLRNPLKDNSIILRGGG